MRIRIALGAILGLAAAFTFVWLQFRAEAIAQDVSPKDEPADSISPFGSNQVFAEPDAELPAPSEPADANAAFADDAVIVDEESATSDPFADDTPPSRTPKRPLPPVVERGDSEGFDPFSSADDQLPSEASGDFDSFGVDSESGSDEFRPVMKDQPLRIIRLRTVRAIEVRSIYVDLFHDEHVRPRWFLSTEAQSNSLIFKGPASYFDQLKKLASELDRLAETRFDRRKKTQSWPIPHDFDDPENGSPADAGQLPLQILRLQHLKAADFAGIAWDLAKSQNSQPKLRIAFEPATNSVVLRGPAAEISQVEQLAHQLDQAAIGAGGGEIFDSPSDLFDDSKNPDMFIANGISGWQEIDGPAVQTQRLREYVAHHDQESVRLASEIRSLRRQHSSNHPQLAEARQKLEDVLKAAFQVRLQLQGLEIAAIKSKLADIESRVQRRSQLRQQIIDRRLHELLGEKDDLSWEAARTGSVQPSSSLDELLPPPDVAFNESSSDFDDLVPGSDDVEEGSVPPAPYAGEIPDLTSGVGPRVEPIPETVSADFLQPDNDAGLGIVGREVPVKTPVTPRPQNGLNDSSRNEGATWQQELIVAENSVETAAVNVERVRSRLSRMKDSDQAEDLAYELQLAELALDQASKLLEQKHRWIAAQRNSRVVNIRYLEKSLELAKSEYELMIETLKKVPGSVPTSEVRRQELEIQRAELRLEQAEADLNVFEVENRTSRTPETKSRTYQDAPALGTPEVATPRPKSRSRAVDDAIDKDVAVEPGISLPETTVPTESIKPSSPPETPSPEPETTPNPVKNS